MNSGKNLCYHGQLLDNKYRWLIFYFALLFRFCGCMSVFTNMEEERIVEGLEGKLSNLAIKEGKRSFSFKVK